MTCFSLQQLIPYVEDDGSKLDDRMPSQLRSASEEKKEVLEVNKVSGLLLYFLTSLQADVILGAK